MASNEHASAPPHPGIVLRERFLIPYRINAAILADVVGVSGQTIRELLHERRTVTPAMALRLSRAFGNNPDFWLKAQNRFDLWTLEREMKDDLSQIARIERQRKRSRR